MDGFPADPMGMQAPLSGKSHELANRMVGVGFLVAVFLTPDIPSEAIARPGIFEYWKAGTHAKKSSGSSLPRTSHGSETGPRTTHAAESARTARDQQPPAWTDAWFSNRDLVRKQLATMREAIAIPMIGERFPLPRGGGFRCTQAAADTSHAVDASHWTLRCVGPDIGGERVNEFYVPAPGTAPVLERVRWVVRAPATARQASWGKFYRELADSLSRIMGPPAWSGHDSTTARWSCDHHETTIQLHSNSARVDSMAILCLSDRLAKVAP
jgi:hypothetical protein